MVPLNCPFVTKSALSRPSGCERSCSAAPQAGEIAVCLIARPQANSVIEIMDAVAVPADGVQPAGNFVIRSDALKRIIDQYSFGDRTVIGFYRSHSGQRICLRPQDLALIEQWFKDPSDVFLIMRPHDGRASAGFFYWQDGSVFGDFALTFPLSEAELKSPSWKSLISGSKHAEWFPLLLARAREATYSWVPAENGCWLAAWWRCFWLLQSAERGPVRKVGQETAFLHEIPLTRSGCEYNETAFVLS